MTAAYRVVELGAESPWVAGAFIVSKKRGRQPLHGSFEDGAHCRGFVDTPAKGRYAYVKFGAASHTCSLGGSDPIIVQIQGVFEATAKFKGKFTGIDVDGRRFEVVYAPSEIS